MDDAGDAVRAGGDDDVEQPVIDLEHDLLARDIGDRAVGPDQPALSDARRDDP